MKILAPLTIIACASGKPAAPPPVVASTPAPAPVSAPPPVADPAPTPAPDPALVEQGKQLMEKFGCISCHTTDGTAKVGPSFKGYFGMKLTEADGTAVVGSEERLRKSLEHAPTLKGYPASMPTYKGLIEEAEAKALVAYLKSL